MNDATGNDAKGVPGKSASGERQGDSPVLEDLKDEGRRLADDARERAEGVAREQKEQGATYLKDVASAVQGMSETLKEQGHVRTASYADIAGRQLDQVGQDIGSREFGEIARDVEEFARQRPALFFGGALIAGFGLARFLKSSARDEHDPARPLDANRN